MDSCKMTTVAFNNNNSDNKPFYFANLKTAYIKIGKAKKNTQNSKELKELSRYNIQGCDTQKIKRKNILNLELKNSNEKEIN